jgi:SpoVK/Ycf46/Vps4 family AAA+-type ATPase
MQTKFMLDGSRVSIIKLNEDQIIDNLPPKVYTVRHNPLTGFYLDTTTDLLELPEKIYGITKARADKCIATYRSRPMTTGILMTGDKGTGKSLLMSVLANKAIQELNLPVVLIQEGYTGVEFTTFIESMGECVLVFDEFGKMYAADSRHNENKPPQSALLSMMDGVDKTKRMFIFTENSQLDVSDYMLNRPSRVYYHFKYKKLDEASVLGYCKDKNVSLEISKDIIDLARRLRIFSFDMLQSIVEEHLRFDCPIDELKTELNIDTTEDRGAMIEIVKIVERSSGKERELFGQKKITKPTAPYGYTWIKVVNNSVSLPTLEKALQACAGSKSQPVEEVEASEEDENQYDEFSIEDKQLAYSDGTKLVYETDDYIVIAQDVKIVTTDYHNLW